MPNEGWSLIAAVACIYGGVFGFFVGKARGSSIIAYTSLLLVPVAFVWATFAFLGIAFHFDFLELLWQFD